MEALRRSGRDARALAGVVVSAVGPATAGALLEHGIAVDLSPQRFIVEGLLESLRDRRDVSGGRVLYPAAEGARDTLPEGLRTLGATVDIVPIYRSVVDGRSAEDVRAAIAADALDLVTFTSASSVHGYVEAVGIDLAVQVPAACIGPITSGAARTARIPVAVEAEESTIAGLMRRSCGSGHRRVGRQTARHDGVRRDDPGRRSDAPDTIDAVQGQRARERVSCGSNARICARPQASATRPVGARASERTV